VYPARRLIIFHLNYYGPEVGALPVIANFAALEQQIILVKTKVNRFRNGGDITD